MNLAAKKKLYMTASEAYYNDKKISQLTDQEFDALEVKIRKADPKWAQLRKTGVPVADKKREVTLEHFMPSLHKFYPEKIGRWLIKYTSTIIMDKLDGSSLQLIYDKGVPVRLITRGDGTLGGDISFLLPFLSIPKKIETKERLVLRCEAVVRRSVFEKHWASHFENARAMANGLLNRKKPGLGLKDLDIVVLGVYGEPLAAGLAQAQIEGFKVVNRAVYKNTTVDGMAKILAARISKSLYDMDGIVAGDVKAVLGYANADKPKWLIAYKENVDLADAMKATVVKIIYQDSLRSRLIPKIMIKPVRLGGTTVTYATCHNAQWMLDRKIGPGAVIKIVRSGDVIPKIVDVVKPGKLQLPTVPYEQKGVHFMSLIRSVESDVKAIHKFFTTLGIEFIAQKTIDTLYTAGLTTVHHYLSIWKAGSAKAFEQRGIGKAMSMKIWNELDRVFRPGVLLRDLMVASNTFDAGLGDRKLKAIEKHYEGTNYNMLASIVKAEPKVIAKVLEEVPGYSHKTIELVVKGMPVFKAWLRLALQDIKVQKPLVVLKKRVGSKLRNVRATFTGYRDKAEEDFIISKGGSVQPFGSTTTILFYKEGGKLSTKVQKAEAKGIRVTTFEVFKKGLT